MEIDEVSVEKDIFCLPGNACCVFKIYPAEAHNSRLRDWIEFSGGAVLDPGDEDPYAIPIVDLRWYVEEKRVQPPMKFPRDHFQPSFVYKSYLRGKLEDLNRHRITKSMYEDFDANLILRREVSWNELRRIPVGDKPRAPTVGNKSEKSSGFAPKQFSTPAKLRKTRQEKAQSRDSRTTVPNTQQRTSADQNMGAVSVVTSRDAAQEKHTAVSPSNEKHDKIDVVSESPQRANENRHLSRPTPLDITCDDNLLPPTHLQSPNDPPEQRRNHRDTVKMARNPLPLRRGQKRAVDSSSDSLSSIEYNEEHFPKRSAQVACSLSETQKEQSRKKWAPYTRDDGQKMIDFICEHDFHGEWKGLRIWRVMEEAKILESRTSQSLWEHFRRQVYPNLKTKYRCSPEDARKFELGEAVVNRGRKLTVSEKRLFKVRTVESR